MTFGPTFCPDACCGAYGPFDFYGKGISHNTAPTSYQNWVDFLYLCDSVREAGVGTIYTSVDEDFFIDYDTTPIAHAAEDKAAIVLTIAPWVTAGEYCWVVRKQNRWHNDSGISAEKIGSTTDLSTWSKGADATVSGDIVTNSAGTHTGTHTGLDNATKLTDSTQSWSTNELVGQEITNDTDSSSGTITANDLHTVTATLAGGTDNDWDVDDAYTVSAVTSAAYIYKTLTLATYTTYELMVVATGNECTQIQVDVDGSATLLDLTSNTGGNVTQVDVDTYEHAVTFTTVASTSVRIELRMVSSSGTTYDGNDGDRVTIEWTSVRDFGLTSLYDVALCDVAGESVTYQYLPSTTDEATWLYTFPKTQLSDGGSPPTLETQTTWPATGYDPQELLLSGAVSTRFVNAGSDYADTFWNTLTGCSVSSTKMAFFVSDVDTTLYEGADVMMMLTGGVYTILIGGPCPRVDIEYPVYGNSDLTYLQDSTQRQWWDTSSSSYKYYSYYYEPEDHHNGKPIVPLIIGMPPHAYGMGWAYEVARSTVYDGANDDPWNASDVTYETNWRIVEVVSASDTAKVVIGDIVESTYNYFRHKPNASNINNWSAETGYTAETLLTASGTTVWTKTVSNTRAVIRTVNLYWDPGKIVIDRGLFAANENTVDCKLLWGDSDGTNHKAIVAYHTTSMTVEDPAGGSSYINNWTPENLASEEPIDTFVSEAWGVEVTGESGSDKTATSYADAATKYRGLCAIGDGKFVFFENLGSGWYRMHVTGTGGWTLLSQSGKTSLPDCVAASERHFYVSGFWLLDDRMEDIGGLRYATNWVFGHKETDNAWPIRKIGTGAAGYDQATATVDSSGLLTIDSIKNSSVLNQVPEQNRYPDRVP